MQKVARNPVKRQNANGRAGITARPAQNRDQKVSSGKATRELRLQKDSVKQYAPKTKQLTIEFVTYDPSQPCSPESERLAAYIQEVRDPGLSPTDRWARLDTFQRPMPKDLWRKIVRVTGGPLGITPKWFAQWKAGLRHDIESLSAEMAKYDGHSHGIKQNNVDALEGKANAIIERLYVLSAHLSGQKPAVRSELKQLIISMQSSLSLITKNPPF